MGMTGCRDTAERVATYHLGLIDWEPEECEWIGQGSQRTVYCDHLGSVVYKIGHDEANVREARVLAALCQQGVDYAPLATLYEVSLVDGYGDTITTNVVAMPYLPDDGSVPGPYPIFPEAADLNPHGNVHANGGQLWLIDAGGL